MASGLFTLKQVNQAVQQSGWSNYATPKWVEYFVVAGGGAGGSQANGNSFGGGGGAGGLLTGIVPVTTGASYTVTVGAGGAAVSNGVGTNGQNSVFGSISSTGGGGGGRFGIVNSGGSGGGNGNYSLSGPATRGGSNTFNQGNNGGGGTLTQTTSDASGGGGGAGTVGFNGFSNGTGAVGGNGGAGIASAISGAVTSYAGGGGGASTNTQGLGGIGGGGLGKYGGTATAGFINTGGGGGGAGYNGAVGDGIGGAGGSGIVILSYPDTFAVPASTTGSPTVSTSGSGSLSFVGASSQAVQFAANSAFTLGSNDFTIELWFYKTSSGTQVFAGANNSGLTVRSFAIGANASNQIYGRIDGGVTYLINSASTISLNTWYHVALVRTTTTLTLYVNGVSAGTTAISGSVGASAPIAIGRPGNANSSYFDGYISNFRYVTGTAVYTANFTTPTTPLTPIIGTQVLVSAISPNGYLDFSTNNFAPVLVGTPTWNQSSPFATGLGYKNRVYTFTSSGSITF